MKKAMYKSEYINRVVLIQYSSVHVLFPVHRWHEQPVRTTKSEVTEVSCYDKNRIQQADLL